MLLVATDSSEQTGYSLPVLLQHVHPEEPGQHRRIHQAGHNSDVSLLHCVGLLLTTK